MEDAITFVAMGIGAFQKYNLHVNFVAGPSAPTLLTTGDADIIRTNFSDAALLAKEGQSVKVFGVVATNTPAGLLAGNSVKSIQALRAMGSNCIIASPSASDFYEYPRYWSTKYGLKCKIDLVSDYPLALDGVVDGRYTAAPQLVSDVGAVMADKKAHWVINPGSAPLPFTDISSVYMTTSAYLSSHKSVIQNFVQALKYAENQMHSMSNQQMAEAIKNSGASIWKPESLADIIDQLTANGQVSNVFQLDKLDLSPLSKAVYYQNLDAQPQENVPIAPSNPEFAYANLVDNSFLG